MIITSFTLTFESARRQDMGGESQSPPYMAAR